MRLPGRALSDPLFDQRNLSRFELLVAIRRRHDFVHIVCDKTKVEFALIGISSDYDRGSILYAGKKTTLGIKAHVGFPGSRVRAVASEAVFGKDGSDIPVEFNLRLTTGRLQEPCRCCEDVVDCSDAHETLLEFSTENSSWLGVI